MVNFQDPAVIASEFAVVVKLWHLSGGIYIWEFFTTLDYEWNVYRGHRSCGWSIWVYSITRVFTLVAVILNMAAFDITSPINCQVFVKFEASFAYAAFAAASLLIMLRLIAIWNWNKIVLVISIGTWLADVALLIRGIARIHAAWSPVTETCVLLNLEATIPSTLAMIFTDFVLIVVMLVGLFRSRIKGAGQLNLARFLWKQGLFWLLLVTLAGVPSSTLLILNLNAPLDLITQVPCIVVVTIAATRMHRSLIKFCDYGAHPLVVSDIRGIPSSQVEVSVRTERDQFPKSWNLSSGTHQHHHKAHEVGLNGDEESSPETF